MPHPATTEQTERLPRQHQPDAKGCADRRANTHRISHEMQAALNAIPSGSVTARTSGALRVPGPRRTIADERVAFEQAVAEENARSMEG